VAESFSNFPSALNTWEISHTAQRGTKAECDGQPMHQSRRELHYLRDGKIYQFVLSTKTGSKRLEHFWLCGDCSKTMILTCVNQSDVKTDHLIQDRANQKGSRR